jgi:UDP-glucose 4-epimerase
MKKKIIVTGGAGFIGCNLVEKLVEKKYNVVVLDNLSTGRLENLSHIIKKIKFINCDISKEGNWVKNLKNAKYVFHLAALADIVPSIENPDEYYQSNVNGTYIIAKYSHKYKIKKLIYSASSSCYGVPKKYPTIENTELSPEYPYALTKLMGEQILMHWNKVYKLNVVSLRLFNVYGLKSRTSGTYGAMFGVFLAQKISLKPFTVVGDGNQTRDFTYVTDVVNAMIKASRSKTKNKIYNVGSGKTISVNKIVELLGGKKIHIPKRPGEPDCTFADINKIKKDIKWKPEISIEEGIKKLIKNLDYWKKAPVWTPSLIKKETKSWYKYLK